MAKRSRESFQKRAREKARLEKQAEKRAKREARSSDDDEVSRVEEDELMQEFARLSARYEADEISDERFHEERHRIFVSLGIEQDD
ncbi:MAG: hypothetical protein PVG83_12085 [Acidimicrobiia bacterium]